MDQIKILITGINGFIGSCLGNYLYQKQNDVTGITSAKNFKATYAILTSNFSINDLNHIINKVKPTIIIHAAGSASVSASFDNPYEDYQNSVIPFISLLEAVRISKQRPRIYFLSSAAVYGNPKNFPITENTVLKPISPYGYHKVECEHEAILYSNYYDIPITILRLFSVFGSKQRKLLLWELFSQIQKTREIVIEGTGNEERDYLHIDDLCRIIASLINSQKQKRYQVINIACGNSIKIKEIVKILINKYEFNIPVTYKGFVRTGNPNIWIADIKRMNKLINSNYYFDFNKKLDETINIWKKLES